MKSSAIFLSVGNHSVFLEYCIRILLPYCDLFVNFYGDDRSQLKTIQNYSHYSSLHKTTKFPALKKIYNISGIDKYRNVFVFDDDCIVKSGDLLSLIDIMNKYDLKIISPSHSKEHKWSHRIMLTHEGDHVFRYTNFIEMNFPVFSQGCLQRYMEIYDGELLGWGNDWWYLNMLGFSHKLDPSGNKVCGIVDSVCVCNPHNHEKKYPDDSIDVFATRESRRLQWDKLRHRIKLHEWTVQNLEFVN